MHFRKRKEKHIHQNNMHKQTTILTWFWAPDWSPEQTERDKLIVTDVYSASFSSLDLSSFSSLIPSDWQPILFGKQPKKKKKCAGPDSFMCLKVANSCSSLIAGRKKEEFDWNDRTEMGAYEEGETEWQKVITPEKIGGIEASAEVPKI